MREERVLIIRLWFQGEDQERQLVGHMASLDDMGGPETPIADVKSVDEVLAVTQRWLSEFVQR